MEEGNILKDSKLITNYNFEDIKEINDKLKISFETKRLMDKGSFGLIFSVKDKTVNKEYAMKVEPIPDDDDSIIHLKYEYKIYRILQGGKGIPKIYDYYQEKNNNILIMELLGPSLEKLFNQNNKKFSLITVLMIIEQILYIIEFIHSKNLIHRDIKPANFLIGKGDKRNTIYVIDFGLSKKYRQNKKSLHIPYRDGKNLIGTARFASINTHLGIEQSRRDDIESIGYMMVYLMKGNLPWNGTINSSAKKMFNRICKIKGETSLDILCSGLPKEIMTFIQYARNMKFEDRPNYSYLRNLVRKMARNNGLEMDYNKFDWIVNDWNIE